MTGVPDSNGNSQNQPAFDRNIDLYPWYVAVYSAFFWMPVFFLYFSDHLTIARVLQLEALYYAVVVLTEVPSGWASDRLGRRTTLIIGATALLGGYLGHFAAGWWFDGWLPLFITGQVGLALGISFHSGTNTSLHYESLAAAGRTDEYDEREAMVARFERASTAAAALIGGALTLVSFSLVYAASALFAVGLIVLAISFASPSVEQSNQSAGGSTSGISDDIETADQPGYTSRGLYRQVYECIEFLSAPALRWLFGVAVSMTVLLHIPYEFYQPYLDLLSISWIDHSKWSGLAAGTHMAIATGLGAWIAGYSIQIRDRFGTRATLLGTVVAEVVLIGLLGAILHPVIAILILARSLPGALFRAPLNAAVTPRVPQSHRASYLSIQSLGGRLAFALSLLGLSLVADVRPEAGAPPSWMALSELLLTSAAVGLVLALLLAATGPDDVDPR